eukprot:Gb_23118 [translate_table: standard]
MEISFMRSLALLMLLIVFSTLNFGIAAQENLCENFDCGKGTCKNSSVFPFVRCECEKGWKRSEVGVEIPFLPCVIPNCTFNHSCSDLAPTPSPPYHGFYDRNYSNILNPCYWDVCGGGTCVPKSNFSYSCDCHQGFGNLMSWTTGYCVRECEIGADCAAIGVSIGVNSTLNYNPNVQITGASPSSSTALQDSGSSYFYAHNFIFIGFQPGRLKIHAHP